MSNCNKTKLYHHIVDKTLPETVKSSQITGINLNPDIAPEQTAQIIDVPSDPRCHQNLQEYIKQATSVIFLRQESIQEAESAQYLAQLLNYSLKDKHVKYYVQKFEGNWKKQVIKQLEQITGNEDEQIVNQIQNIDINFNNIEQLEQLEKRILKSE